MATTAQAQAPMTASKMEATTSRQPREDEIIGIAALAFESLLNSTRTLIRAESKFAPRVSPSQMFEAPVTDEADPPATSPDSDRRADRAEVRNDVEKVPGDVAARRMARSPGENGGPAIAKALQNAPASWAGEQVALARSERLPWDEPSVSPAPITHDGGAEELAIARKNLGAASLRSDHAWPQVGLKAVPSGGGIAAGVNAARAPGVAQQVGELLGGTRNGLESAQPVSPSAIGVGRENAPPARIGESGLADRPTQTESSARRSDETAAEKATPFERLIRSIRLQTGLRSSSARLHLHPPELGRLWVDVRLVGEQVEISVRTETDAARELISVRGDELKAALDQHGIQIRRLDVTAQVYPDLHPGPASYDGPSVHPDGRRNRPWSGARRGSGEWRLDDASPVSASGGSSTTAAVAPLRLDIRV